MRVNSFFVVYILADFDRFAVSALDIKNPQWVCYGSGAFPITSTKRLRIEKSPSRPTFFGLSDSESGVTTVVPMQQLLTPHEFASNHTLSVLKKELVTLQSQQSDMQHQAGQLISDLQHALTDIRVQQQQLGSILQMQGQGLSQVGNTQTMIGEDLRSTKRVQV